MQTSRRKNASLVKELRLIEDLVDFQEEYTYHTTYKNGQNDLPIHFPLLAYCVYSEVKWEDIAYIQQLKKIENATNIQVELQKEHWQNKLVKESLLDISKILVDYKPYLMMGDVYVDFVTDKDNWSEKLRNAYREFPEQVKNYLEYMAEHFNLVLTLQSNLAGYESKTEEISKSTQDWLGSYAKTLRNMVETVIKEIKDQRSFTQDSKRQALCQISQSVLAHLDACDEAMLKKTLDEKAHTKVTDFIKALRENVNKVSPVPAYNDTKFFTPPSSSASENQQESEIDKVMTNSL